MDTVDIADTADTVDTVDTADPTSTDLSPTLSSLFFLQSQEFSVYDHSLAHRYPPPHPGQLPPAIDRAASIVGFTSTNFFHFVMAAMPRLVALLPLLRKAASTAKPVRLIVPEQQNRGFVDAVRGAALYAYCSVSQLTSIHERYTYDIIHRIVKCMTLFTVYIN